MIDDENGWRHDVVDFLLPFWKCLRRNFSISCLYEGSVNLERHLREGWNVKHEWNSLVEEKKNHSTFWISRYLMNFSGGCRKCDVKKFTTYVGDENSILFRLKIETFHRHNRTQGRRSLLVKFIQIFSFTLSLLHNNNNRNKIFST